MDSTATNNFSPSSSSTSTSSTPHPPTAPTTTTTTSDPIQSWWESISKARSRILSLSSILQSDPNSSSFSLSSLADSDRPALSFLSSIDAYNILSLSLSNPLSGSGSDPLCQWLYDTYLSSDSHLRLLVLSFVPLLLGLYLSRVHSSNSTPSLSGFEAVLLAIYSSEAKSRGGKPNLVHIPDLSQPSLYHTPRNNKVNLISTNNSIGPSVGVLSPPLEPQIAVKSTKRPIIVGVVLDCYFKQISQMPTWSKVELCKFATSWAGQDCVCKDKFDGVSEIDVKDNGYFLEGSKGFSNGYENNSGYNDDVDDVTEQMEDKLGFESINSEDSESKGVRILLPWEILQPLLRILGHCLLGPLNSQDVKDAASVAVRRLYARASHDLAPQAILATRSLIQLDKRAREAAKMAAAVAATVSSNANTPSKAKKPEILLVSK